MPILPLDPRNIHTRSIFERTSKLKEGEMAATYARGMTVSDFFQCLPDQLSAKGLKDLACSILEAKRRGAPCFWGSVDTSSRWALPLSLANGSILGLWTPS